MLRRTLIVAIAAFSFLSILSLRVQAQDQRITVFAAASLKGSLDKVAALYEKKFGVKVTISFAASSALAKQIEADAPADLFLSADLKWMSYLVDRKLVRKDDVVKLLGNRLVLVAARDSAISIKIGQHFPLARTLGDAKIAMGEPKSVPAGLYGRQALQYYGVWNSIEANVAPADNVRAALKLVSLGEAPLGIVYETDAKADRGVRVIDTFPEESHEPIIYPVAPIAASTNAKTRDFLSFLAGTEAQAVFKEAGFSILADS